MLSGIVPFSADSEYEILTAQVQQEPQPPTVHYPHIPPAVEAAVMRALSKDPNRRFASTAEFGLALEGFTGPRAEVPAADPLVQTVRLNTMAGARPAPVERSSNPAVTTPPPVATPQRAPLAQPPADTPAAAQGFVWTKRRKQMAAGAGVLVLLLITALIVFLSRPAPPPDPNKFNVHPPGEEASAASKNAIEEKQKQEQEQSAPNCKRS